MLFTEVHAETIEAAPLSVVPALASQVTIHRDAWGVAHVFGETDEATIFGAGYAQAEDYFWQVEDNCIRAIGRHAEFHGKSHLKSDLLNRMFEIVRHSKEDFERVESFYQRSITAFVDGLNYYLATHPEVKPRLITHFEPWHVLAMERHFLMDFCYGRTHAGSPKPIGEVQHVDPGKNASVHGTSRASLASWDWNDKPLAQFEQCVQAAIGSNAWAIAPSKTKSGHAMLLINPHQPWYGWGQFYEIHIRSATGMNFTGACFYGNPIPSMGHNQKLGWAYTVNDPDIADAWRVTFDDPDEPLNYRYEGGYRKARRWTDEIAIRHGNKVKRHTYEFRATHHGPIARRNNETTYTAVQIGGLLDLDRVYQAYGMLQAQDYSEWRRAFSHCAIPMFNCVYADVEGNIFYCYNGSIPVRDPSFDWTKPVDGSLQQADWQGIHALDHLPQVINPPSGYVQNCNSSPFVATDEGSPARGDYPAYMLEDADHDKRRSKLSRMLLRQAQDLSFDSFQKLATDNRLYWPLMELPKFKRHFTLLQQADPERAAKVEPYLQHLLDWDCCASLDSTQTLLCLAWYEELYGLGYPAERLRRKYQVDPFARLDALVKAAAKVRRVHGDWKVAWGDVHRLQRVTRKASVTEAAVSMNGFFPSFPCSGAPGPLGIVFTVYSSPTVPLVRPCRYAVVGNSYLAAIEFGKRVKAASVTPFGVSADRKSNHYLDQTKLFSERKLKPAWFYEDEVLANSRRSYKLSEVK